MAASVSNVDVLLSLRDGFERFASKTDEIGHTLEIELRYLLEAWDERVQKAHSRERECQNDLSDALRDLRWCQGRSESESVPNCSYEEARVEKARRALVEAGAHLQLIGRCAREIQMACEAFQKHGRALRQIATQTAPNASSGMNTLLRDIERHSFVTPANSIAHTSIGGTINVPLTEKTVEGNDSDETTDVPSRVRPVASPRGLTALLRGQLAPAAAPDLTQIELAVRRLRSISELASEIWETLQEQHRASVLCSVECVMAEFQGRPPVPVVVESGERNVYGGYNPQVEFIVLNPIFVLEAKPRDIVETIVHAGRHAYQAYAMRHPAFHLDADEVGRWRINNLYYLRADVWGYEAYRNQSVEQDAFVYAEAIIRQLYGEAQ